MNPGEWVPDEAGGVKEGGCYTGHRRRLSPYENANLTGSVKIGACESGITFKRDHCQQPLSKIVTAARAGGFHFSFKLMHDKLWYHCLTVKGKHTQGEILFLYI